MIGKREKKGSYRPPVEKGTRRRALFSFFKIPALRIAILTFTVAFLGGVLATISVHRNSVHQLKQSHQDSLKLVGRMTAKGVDVAKLAKIRTSADQNSPAFISAKQSLGKSLNSDPRIKYAYIVKPDGSKRPKFVVDCFKDSKSSDSRSTSPFSIGEIVQPAPKALTDVINSGIQVTDLTPFKDRWGEFVSSYTPITKGKRVIAVVVLDLNYAFFLRDKERLNGSLLNGIVSSAVISLLMALGAGLYRWKIRPEAVPSEPTVVSSNAATQEDHDVKLELVRANLFKESVVKSLAASNCMIWSGHAKLSEGKFSWSGNLSHDHSYKWLIAEMASGETFTSVWTRIRDEETNLKWNRAITSAIQSKLPTVDIEFEVHLETGKSIYFNEQISLTYVSDTDVKLVSMLMDITEHRAKDERVRSLAFYDTVTGLINRTRIHEVIKDLLRDKPKLSLICIEISNFRNVNESWGPEIGDRLLREVGASLSDNVGHSGIVGRLSGDDFVVIVPEEAAVSWLVSKIDEACQKPILIDGVEVAKICRIGYVTAEEGDNAIGLIRKANLALETARKNLAHYPVPYKAEMSFKAKMRVELETAMRQALADREFYLMFQPIYCNKTKKLVKAEALLRWNSSRFGPVNPSTFIPIAEESDFINVLGNYVIDETARAISKLNKSVGDGIVTVSMNLSLRQLKNQSTLNSFSSALDRWNIHPRNMLVEITESSIMHDASEGTTMLNQLQDRGFSLAIDDFGTGYSSLATLATLPFNCLKIDKRFVDGIGVDKKQEEVLGTVVRLARALNLQIVAEGIEHENQFEFLRSLEVEFSQGYYFAKPLAFEDLERLAIQSHERAA